MATTDVVRLFRDHPLLQRHAATIEAAGITGDDLVELRDPATIADVLGVKTKLGARSISKAVSDVLGLLGRPTPDASQQAGPQAAKVQQELPEGKRFG